MLPWMSRSIAERRQEHDAVMTDTMHFRRTRERTDVITLPPYTDRDIILQLLSRFVIGHQLSDAEFEYLRVYGVGLPTAKAVTADGSQPPPQRPTTEPTEEQVLECIARWFAAEQRTSIAAGYGYVERMTARGGEHWRRIQLGARGALRYAIELHAASAPAALSDALRDRVREIADRLAPAMGSNFIGREERVAALATFPWTERHCEALEDAAALIRELASKP
jgi:hypothetical protein